MIVLLRQKLPTKAKTKESRETIRYRRDFLFWLTDLFPLWRIAFGVVFVWFHLRISNPGCLWWHFDRRDGGQMAVLQGIGR